MRPVVFDGCFGWLHRPAGSQCADVAVLICPGLMVDGLLAHASLRVLAEKLSAAGYCTLRFDYPGTGDSRELDVAAGEAHWVAWKKSVSVAIEYLREQAGVARVVLCGVRAGGTLAVLTANERPDVAGLVLFEPVVSGRSYVRQLILDADLQVGRVSDRSEGLVIREFQFSPATLAEINGIDLAKTRPRAGLKVCLFYRPDAKPVEICARAWNEGDLAIADLGWNGLETLLRLPELNEAPCPDFAAVLNWLRTAVPATTHKITDRPSDGSPSLILPECVEQPMQFGAQGRLFGILCRPAADPLPERVVIIANSGRDPHYGGSRHNVSVARRLARAGIASLRLDFAGVGDGVGPAGREEFMSSILTDRREDFGAAVDLVAGLGFRSIAAQGLCVGAYHSLQAALEDPRIDAVALVNIVFFSLPSTDTQLYLDQRGRTPATFVRKVLRWQSWVTLLRGRSYFRHSLQALLANLRQQATPLLRGVSSRLRPVDERPFGVRAMAALSARGVRTLFAFSPGDVDIDAFAREFGRNGEGLTPFPGAVMRTVPGMDHNLSILQGRQALETMIIEFFKGTTPSQATDTGH
jgi:pimeloyl-ACP methyl ester carboxylesterase